MRKSVKPLAPDFVGTMRDGGVDIPIVINKITVGAIRLDAGAAALAIFQANLTPQEALLYELGSICTPSGRPEALAQAAGAAAAALGAEIRVYARMLASTASVSALSAYALLSECRGCGRYFVPALQRTKASKGGRKPIYCAPPCRKLVQKSTTALAKKAAAERERRQRLIRQRLKLKRNADLEALRTDAELLSQLQRSNPDRFRIIEKHMRGRRRQSRAAKPRVS